VRAGTAAAGVVAAAVLLLAACGGSGDEPGLGAGGAEATNRADVPFDRAFIDAMVPHHEGAIAMARVAMEAGLSEPELVEIADAVVATQQEEIDRMRSWREEWYGSAEIDPEGAAALGLSAAEMGMQHDAHELASAGDVDAAFAAMMIDHHEGAVTMAGLALERAEHEEIRQLAREIVDAQEREIAVMRRHAGMHH
jgi:uncharacterized protein (DUF305 family)